jgi:steroid delta-isomerase-like uncharacterized protein
MAQRLGAAMMWTILSGCAAGNASTPPPAATPASPATTPSLASPVATTTPAAMPANPKGSLADLEKKALADWYSAFNSHDAKKLASLYAADARSARTGPGGWETKEGPAGVEKGFAPLFTAFPDLRAAPARVLQKNDLLVVEWVASGTNSGELNGAATNKKAAIYGCDVFWFNEAGAIQRQETFHDDATILQQIGKMPGKARDLAVLPDKDAEWIVAVGTPEEDALVEKMKNTWPATWNKRDAKGYDAVLNDDSEHDEIAGPVDYKGRAALMKEFQSYSKALPDMTTTIDKAWAFAPNIVVAEFTFTGTMKGPLGALKATNKPITIHGLEIDELKAGKMQKAITYSNGLELLAALNMLPKHGAPKGGGAEKAEKGEKAEKATGKK